MSSFEPTERPGLPPLEPYLERAHAATAAAFVRGDPHAIEAFNKRLAFTQSPEIDEESHAR